MKKTVFITLMALALFSCEEQGELTRDGFLTSTVSSSALLKYSGTFQPTSGISVTGSAQIFLENGNWKLQLDNFSISDGPDLKIYLSKSASPVDFVTLGNLTSSTVYNIPVAIDFNQYNYVLIHCQQYNHLFAIAPLTQI